MQAVVLGFVLAADAAVVTAAVSAKSARAIPDVLRLSVVFGVAQALMAGLGAGAGHWVGAWLGTFHQWVAAAILVGLAGIALRRDDDTPPPVGWAALSVLAVATATDALAAGVALPAMGLPIVLSCAVIGVVTTGCCAVAGWAGARLGARFGRRMTVAGAIALLGLAVWIVLGG